MTELRLSFTNLQKSFMEKNPNGKIEKSNGSIKVWYDACSNNSYKYIGTMLEVANKLNLKIHNNYSHHKEVESVVTRRQTGKMIVSSDDMGYWTESGIMEIDYVIENGRICLLTLGRGLNELKLYQSKNGYYFNYNGKRQNVEVL